MDFFFVCSSSFPSLQVGGMAAGGLVLDAHGRCLRVLSASAQRHFEGLSQAARTLKLPSPLRRRLRDLDAAAAYVRHITVPRVQSLEDEVIAALGQVPEQPGDHADDEASYDLFSAPPSWCIFVE